MRLHLIAQRMITEYGIRSDEARMLFYLLKQGGRVYHQHIGRLAFFFFPDLLTQLFLLFSH